MTDGQLTEVSTPSSTTKDDDITYVAIGSGLGVMADDSGRDPDTLSTDPLPWFRIGRRYLQITWPSYLLLTSLTFPRNLAGVLSFCASASLENPTTLLDELVHEQLVTELPETTEGRAWQRAQGLRVISHAVGLGQSMVDRRYFIIAPLPNPHEEADGRDSTKRGASLGGLDYYLWTTFDGSRRIEECATVTAERTGQKLRTVNERIPALLRVLTANGLATLDEVVE